MRLLHENERWISRDMYIVKKREKILQQKKNGREKLKIMRVKNKWEKLEILSYIYILSIKYTNFQFSPNRKTLN